MLKIFKKTEVKIIFCLSFIPVIILFLTSKIPQNVHYEAFLSVSASLFGFLITVMSILLVFPDNGRIFLLKQHNDYELLFMIFLFSIFLQIIIFIFSLVGMLCNNFKFLNIIFIFVLNLSILFIILDIWILKRMINILCIKE